MEFIAEEISRDTYVNLMNQYYPAFEADEYEKLNRRITEKELEEAYHIAEEVGLNRIIT